MSKLETIELPTWYTVNGMMYRRECLSGDHSEHPYNYIKNKYGVNPEDYGIEKPYIVCPHCDMKINKGGN